MRLSFSLDQRQIQKQIQTLAPRMIQSMEILQLPILELQERIEQELTENPVLEVVEEEPEEDEPVVLENPNLPTEDEKPLVVKADGNNAEDFERLSNLDEEIPEAFDDSPRPSVNRLEEEADRQHDLMANLPDRPPSLQDYLLEQLRDMEVAPDVAEIAERIISTLDARDGGYFRGSLHDLVPREAGPQGLEKAKQALAIVQKMEPRGVGARDLRECLLLQLTPDMPYYRELKLLISNHLEDLRDNRIQAIAAATKLDIPTIYAAWEQLRRLNPRPAAQFAEEFTPVVVPDLYLEVGEDGKYQLRLEDDQLPSLRISEYYRRRLQDGTATPEEREFIKRKINSANWLIEAIEQRRNTLLKVAQAIVEHQWKFLEYGPEYIEPLKMQQIADKVGVHVTTVSRAVDDKWIQTPRGLFPLRRFFVGGTRSYDGEDVAWDVIRVKLQEIIDHEDKSNPLSDDNLVKELAKHGLKVARRTVTKYRQKMGIPTARQRKQWLPVERTDDGPNGAAAGDSEPQQPDVDLSDDGPNGDASVQDVSSLAARVDNPAGEQ
ncbi:MAG: RNA polymerase sigma-54 factor [Pirellulaceae bacterium]|nr:MAG: RNA polymerase sigma-54 factor [Pirellulaceae bacterium]